MVVVDETAQDLAPDDLRPLLTIPRLAKAPTVDGVLAEGEWDAAAAVMGFAELNSRKWAERQTTVFAGYDERGIYFAFRCPHHGRIEPAEVGRDEVGGHQTEAIEVWLQPPNRPWYQFLGMPGGATLDASETQHLAWDGDWDFKDAVHDLPEEIGGIQSFQKKLWTAEIAIRFEDLGVTAPSDGETWAINFTRDFGAPQGQKRSGSDWTSWSPMRGRFRDVEQFGSAVFRRDAPAVQLLRIGDLVNGDLALKGLATGGDGTLCVSVRTTFADSDKTVAFSSADVPVSRAGSAFSLPGTLKVNESTDLLYQAMVEEVESDRVLASLRIPFGARAALRVKAIPVFSADTLYVHADATRVASLPDGVTVEATVFRGDASTGQSVTETWARGQRSGDLTMSLADLAPGAYQVKTFVRAAPGAEPLLASTAPFVIPEGPEWAGNRIGISDRVPRPWRPVGVTGGQVRTTQREYHLGPVGLPAQIVALDEELFAGPPALAVVIGGRPEVWKADTPRLVRHEDTEAVWQVRAAAGPLRLSGTLTVEFDGFALWDCSISADGPVSVDSLALEFPFRRDRSLYARGRDATMADRGAFAALLGGQGMGEDALIAGGHFSRAGWVWPDQWCHEVWVGDDERGLSVVCETQESLRGAKRTEILQSGEANTLQIHLIDGPHVVDGSLSYAYAWQATPVKPRPDDPRTWHATYRRKGTDDALVQEDVPNRIGTPLDMWALKYTSYPAHRLTARSFEQRNGYL
jgi:hypothetical protein